MTTELWIAPDGSDANSGTREQPCASLEGAREALRARPERAGATVWLRGGIYRRTAPFALTAADSGTAEAPITYRACPGEEPRLVGGQAVDGWAPVTDSAVRERLHEEAREHVVQADLRAQGVTDFGTLTARGFSRETRPAPLELFFLGRPMTLARWPSVGWASLLRLPQQGADGVGEGEAGFFFHDEALKRWTGVKDLWMHGYWVWDWADSHDSVAALDPDTGLIRTRPPHGVYGYRTGQRFYFYNLLEELDTPGEYYVDRDSGLLYFWPPEPVTPDSAWVSLLEAPLVTLDNVSHVTLHGLTLEGARGSGVQISGGEGVLVAGCTLRNLGNWGVQVTGGQGHGVAGCDLQDLGDGGLSLEGGDRQTLAPSGHYADNNHISHTGRWVRCYTAPVLGEGVGLRITHNLIEECPHCAILVRGNDHLVEFNEIHDVALETGDVGGFYMGRDYSARGNVVRYNFFHHLGGGQGLGSMSVYLDDCASGVLVYGNIFYRVDRGVLIGGGRDNRVENNLFLRCRTTAVHIDARGLAGGGWNEMIYETLRERLEAVNAFEPPYSERYPALLDLTQYYAPDAPRTGIAPEGNVLVHNVALGGEWLQLLAGTTPEMVEVHDNLVGVDPGLEVGGASCDWPADSPAYAVGWKRIPCEQIGLYADEYRSAKTLPGRSCWL